MFKNVATKIALFAFDTTTGAAKTGDAANLTAYVSKDYGSTTVLADTSATEQDATNAKGWYLFDVAQTEANADALLFTAKSTTSNISIVGQYIHTTPASFTSFVTPTGAAVNATQIGSQTASAAGTVTFPGTVASATNITAGTITTVTNLTNAPTAGDLTATMKTSVTTAATAATPIAASVTGAVGSVTGAVGSVTARVTANTDQLAGQTVTAAAGVTFPASVASPTNITAGVITTATNLTNAPTVGDLTATMKTSVAIAVLDAALSGHAVSGSVGEGISAASSAGDPWATALPGAYGAGTAGKIVGDNINATISSRSVAGDAMALTSGERTSLAGVVWATVMEGSRTAIQYMRGFAAALMGKASGMATTTATFRDTGDSKDRIVATVDADGNRSAVTLDLT